MLTYYIIVYGHGRTIYRCKLWSAVLLTVLPIGYDIVHSYIFVIYLSMGFLVRGAQLTVNHISKEH